MMRILVLLMLLIPTLASSMVTHKTKTDMCSGRRLSEGPLIDIDEHNWEQLLGGEWLLSVCALNKEDCRKLELNWYQLAVSVGRSINVGAAIVDLSKETTLLRRLSIVELPTVYHVKNGAFRKLASGQDINTLRRIVHQQEWQKIRPLPFWKHPSSIWTCLSVFAYKAALDLWKSGVLGDDYQRATWGICVMFTSIVTSAGLLFYILCSFGKSCLDNFKENLDQEKQNAPEKLFEFHYLNDNEVVENCGDELIESDC